MSATLLTLSFIGTRVLGLERTVRAFDAACRLGQRLPGGRQRRSTAEIAERVARGLKFTPLPIECLDQALVTWYCLNRGGYPAILQIGMKLSPVSGHAWVSCGDEHFVKVPGLEDFTVVAHFPPPITVR
jgi:Transglutaminase-like superfamily